MDDSYLNNTNKNKHTLFIYDCINSFRKEIENYSRKNKEINCWIDYGESALLSLFLAGVIRNDKENNISVLGEFGVRDNESFVGRCDLFLNCNNTPYLIEAKKVTDRGRNKRWIMDNSPLINKIFFQLKRYIQNQKHHYFGFYNKPQLVSLIFNQVIQKSEANFNNYLEKSQEYTLEISNDKENFYTCLVQGKGFRDNHFSALEVYGRIEQFSFDDDIK